MYFAYKYARKKYNERKQAKATDGADPEAVEPVEAPPSDGQPAVLQQPVLQSDRIENATAHPEKAALTDEEKAQPAVEEKTDAPKEDPVEKKRRRKYRYKIIFGLMAPFALQALDTTIIASALPFIAQDFSKKTYPELSLCINYADRTLQTRSNSSTGSSLPSTSPRPPSSLSGPRSPTSSAAISQYRLLLW
jgi:hypothetical protein